MFSDSASQIRRRSDAAATVSSFGYGRWVSGTVHLPYFFLRIPIRFGNRKLAQEGSAFAPKRNPAIFLFSAE